MKKLISVFLILTIVLINLILGTPATGVLSAGAASAKGFEFTSVKEETISAIPSSPYILNILIFGSTTDGGTDAVLSELSSSQLCKVEQYHFIFVDILKASKADVVKFSEGFSPNISFCYGDYFKAMWGLILDKIDSSSVSVPAIAFVDDSGYVQQVTVGIQGVAQITTTISSVLGDRFIEPEKDKDYVTIEVTGSYYTNIQEALYRINEIRYEACAEGIEDPRNPGRKLTLSDYHPVVWSSELEKDARIRAAEGIVCQSHTRPNGKQWSTANTFIYATILSENLAWNYSKDMVVGINQFYGEKEDWINHTGKQTGHYTSMINPNFYSVGLGGFYSDCGYYPSCLAFWLSNAKEGFDQSFGHDTAEVTVPFEIRTSYLSNPRLVIDDSQGENSNQLLMIADVEINKSKSIAYLSADIEWTSSDESILTVNNGMVIAHRSGSAVVTASSFCGLTASLEIKVTDADIPTQPPSVPATAPPVTQSPPPQGQVIRGDADLDTDITILDATTIQRYLASLSTVNYSEIAADADADGDVTILDATSLQRYIASLPTYEGIGKPILFG